MAVNEMGELAYVMSEKENLVSSVLTTFMTRSYYETEDEAVAKIKAAADGSSPPLHLHFPIISPDSQYAFKLPFSGSYPG